MLSKLTIKFKKNNKITELYKENNPPYFLGVLLQGFLMSKVSKEYADKLHEIGVNKYQEVRPYSQYCYYESKEDALYWVVSTIGEEAKKNILDMLVTLDTVTITISGEETTLHIDNFSRKSTTLQEIVDKRYMAEDDNDLVRIKFKTPTVFTRDSVSRNFQHIPDPYTIFKGLLDRYSVMSNDFDVNTEETLEYLKTAYILDFSIKSVRVKDNKATTPTCVGYVTIKFSTTREYGTFLKILTDLAEYTGVGLKTARGYGGVEVKVY